MTETKTRKYNSLFHVIGMIVIILSFCVTVPCYAKAEENTGQVEENAGQTTETEQKDAYEKTEDTVSINGKALDLQGSAVIKVNDFQMVDVSTVFQSGLNCSYNFDESTGNGTITNEDLEIEISFQIGNKMVTVQDEQAELSIEPMTVEEQRKKGQFVPVMDVAKMLGFAVSYSEGEKQLKILSPYLLYQKSYITDYDSKLYSNLIDRVDIKNESTWKQEVFEVLFVKDLKTSNVTVENSVSKRILTVTLKKTANNYATGTTKISSGKYVSKVVSQLSGSTQTFKIYYNSGVKCFGSLEKNVLTFGFEKASYAMRVKLPDGVKASKVADNDYYYKKQFTLSIPNKDKSFYKNNFLISNLSAVGKCSVSYGDTKTKITVTTTKLQGYSYKDKNGYLELKVGDPRKIYKNIVVLDAGHGGKDSGAVSRGKREKDINLKIIYTYAKTYFNGKNSPVKAYWTRYNDTYVTLYDRAAFASKVGADLFVSLHMNSASRSGANGTETYYSKKNNKAQKNNNCSKLFAQKMQKNLVGELNMNNRGVKEAGFVVTKYNSVPAILIELGFISGSKDYKKITNSSYQKKAAKAIYDGVCADFTAYPTGR